MADARPGLIRLIYERPVEIAWALGYDKLTDLHNGWIGDMVFGDGDETLQAHRGSYKTTCIGISLALIILLFPGQRTIFMRKTDTDVAEVLSACAAALENPYFKAISRELYGMEHNVVTATQGAVSTDLKLGVSGAPQLIGLGCGASLTGKHADRIFTDDIINVKDRVSAAERNRIKLIYQELQNIRNRGGRIFNTGTPWHKDDAFSLMPNIVRHDCYSTGLISRDELAQIERSMSVSLFAANYKLKHIADEEAMFSEPRYFSDPSLLRDGIGHIDAAYGGADGTAFTAVSRSGGKWRAMVRLWPGVHVDKCLDEILALARRLRIGTIWCERNADKGYLRKEIVSKGHPARDYAEHQNKYMKIDNELRSRWADVELLDCPEYPLDAGAVNEILDYNEHAEHDDMPDSLASAMRQLGAAPTIKLFREGM